ncbi:Hypothetical protein R9X50_00627400 [Acrodontium crateriforme]|uniref:Myotubularin phosphatase domain-containing protein n=1 Tax=Acrodontium crateriforme TaxID=150365 RepID=A0AAQ3M9E5_9PEZI|nr:Hypothetical protein R9X50_00627400 [Acrodontium crateriforme]
MGESSKSASDIRVHNVSIHRRGKAEYGTLSLTRHHLTFTFTPDSPKDRVGESSGHHSIPSAQINASPSFDSPKAEPVATLNSTANNDTPGKLRTGRPKARPRTIWIAYPMINYCVLRPSHLQSNTVRAPVTEGSSSGDDNDLFPPTVGTNTYSSRPSTDSSHLTPYSSPRRVASPAPNYDNASTFSESGRPPAIRIRCRDFQMMALHFHPSSTKSPDNLAREVFFSLRSRCCVNRIEDMLAFHFQCPKEELEADTPVYDAKREFARMGISEKAAEGPGSAWRISDINSEYGFSPTYPSVLCVPRAVSDNMLKYGGAFRSRARIPSLAYLHFNGGSITRSSQPMVGFTGKRNPQDEKLVSAIFSSHTPISGSPSDSPPQTSNAVELGDAEFSTLDSDAPVVRNSQGETALDERDKEAGTPARRKIYGSTRKNYIVDARPKLNALANRTGGGGVEDVANYVGSGDLAVEKVFLNIPNIHVMRASLEKVIESFANSDYLDLPPNQDTLRKSGWLGHIQTLLEGSELVARVVGLGGSHVLVHCSDGWDRTSQVSALAQIMLDPHYRTLTGFITLVQKDFLSYGHKFRDRNGIQGSEKWFEIENERIAPSKNREDAGADATTLNVLGTKALTGAKNWFEKNRGTLFRQQNTSRETLNENTASSSVPPPNPIIHAPATTNKEEKEHKTKTDEIAPIFHQFLDAIYQLQRQHPNAFEFNERFLLRLLYQVYSGQYGEFLFDNEQSRSNCQGKTPSVWSHFLARRAEFINPDFGPKADDAFLLPNRGVDNHVEVRWWSNLFKRTDQEMNVPRALLAAESASLTAESTSLSINGSETQLPGSDNNAYDFTSKGATSTPLSHVTQDDGIASLTSSYSTLTNTKPKDPASDTAMLSSRPVAAQNDIDVTLPAKTSADSSNSITEAVAVSKAPFENKAEGAPQNIDEDDDPLGVTSSLKNKENASGLDFAAFASQNAFQER